MNLDDLLNADDFALAANGVAAGCRAEYGLPPLSQLGIVVESVEDAAAGLESRGLGPFLILDGSAKLWRERGQALHFRGKMGLCHHQGIELELLEPGEGSDFYRRSLPPAGGVTVQHLGFAVQDVDGRANTLIARGVPLLVRGRLETGPLVVDFAYLDTIAEVGLVVELLCWRILGIPFRLPGAVQLAIGRVEKWSGRRSITT